MGLRECDELCDMFPGSGAVSHYFRLWLAEKPWICTANAAITDGGSRPVHGIVGSFSEDKKA